MQALTIVVYQADSRISQALADEMSRHFSAVYVVDSLLNLRDAIARQRADVAIFDIEASQIAEVERLHQEYPWLSIVCTHRVADEEMWASVLNAGASDMCPACDTNGIVLSAQRQGAITHLAA